MIAMADAVEIGGIYYNLIEKGKVAEVTSNPNYYKGDVVIPEKVTYNDVEYRVEVIGNNAFERCSGLTTITIPNSVTKIGESAFSECSSLTSITIPNCVITIGRSAFSFCSGLTSITIPTSVSKIGTSVLSGCEKLTSIKVESKNNTYDSRDNCNAIIETSSNTLIAGCKNTTIPNSVTSIGKSAFNNCLGLSSITIPNSVTSIGVQAFVGCSDLTSITIPNSVTSIGLQTFFYCSGLTSITIPNSVTSIDFEAFLGCSNLENVYCHAEKVPSTDTDAFNKSYIQYATLHVPASAINAYKATSPWNEFGTIKAIDGGGETKKCSKPTISYDNFKLTYNCETKDVEYISDISDADIGTYYETYVDLCSTYEISVYATKSGYDNSDVATATLVWTNAVFTANSTTNLKAINQRPLLIQSNDGAITIQGADDGEYISIYNIAGSKEGSAVSRNGRVTINTNIQPGNVAIVKVGSKALKIIIK